MTRNVTDNPADSQVSFTLNDRSVREQSTLAIPHLSLWASVENGNICSAVYVGQFSQWWRQKQTCLQTEPGGLGGSQLHSRLHTPRQMAAPQKTPSFAMCSIQRDKPSSAIDALRSCVNTSMPNFTLYPNTLPVHFKTVMELKSHFTLPSLHSGRASRSSLYFYLKGRPQSSQTVDSCATCEAENAS